MVHEYICAAMGMIGGIFVGCLIANHFTTESIREEAVKSNAAHYVCDQTTGKCEFQFKGV